MRPADYATSDSNASMSARPGCQRAADEQILEFALGKNSVVVTLDSDFHTILAVSGAVGPSVIRGRIEGLRALDIAECVHFVSVNLTAN